MVMSSPAAQEWVNEKVRVNGKRRKLSPFFALDADVEDCFPWVVNHEVRHNCGLTREVLHYVSRKYQPRHLSAG